MNKIFSDQKRYNICSDSTLSLRNVFKLKYTSKKIIVIMISTKYTKEIIVKEDDIDELNHVNNVRYVQWIQDISKDHWFSSIKGKLSTPYIWVVASHFIEYKSSALLNDELSIETYVEKFEGAMSYRHVEIKNSKTNRIIVKALTKWCLIDFKTKKSKQIPSEILELEF